MRQYSFETSCVFQTLIKHTRLAMSAVEAGRTVTVAVAATTITIHRHAAILALNVTTVAAVEVRRTLATVVPYARVTIDTRPTSAAPPKTFNESQTL